MTLQDKHIQSIMEAVLEAGDLIKDYATSRNIGHVTSKSDGTPVTIVDRLAEDIIVNVVQGLALPYPIIAEERFSEGLTSELGGGNDFWLIDALDGTKEFIAGTGEYTVNIALILKGEPAWGLIYAPETKALYVAEKGAGTYFYSVHQENNLSSANKCLVRSPNADLTLVTSARQRTHTLNKLYGDYVIAKRVRKGSSLKFCMIANGTADIYPRMGPTSEWDTAAADIILREAGGVIIDLEKNTPLRYGGQHRRFLNPYFAALSTELYNGNPDFFVSMKTHYLNLQQES